MKTFYLLRSEDVHNNSGTGVVAEGIVFDNKMVALTWLTPHPTVTVFHDVMTVKLLHGHGGKTELILEGKHSKFDWCRQEVRKKKIAAKRKIRRAK